MASNNNGGQKQNMDIINKISYKANYDKRPNHGRANYDNTKKLSGTVENTTRYQSDPTGNVINLSKETFTKETGQLFKKKFKPQIF